MSDSAEHEGAAATNSHKVTSNVREVRIRLPRSGIAALKQNADADETTVNALVARYIDQGLRADGRPGLFELAPWFRAYLRRKGGRGHGAGSIEDDQDFT